MATVASAKSMKSSKPVIAPGKTKGSPSAGSVKKAPAAKGAHVGTIFAEVFRATPTERINRIRSGIPAGVFIETIRAMGLPKEQLLATLHFARATVNRRIKDKGKLPTEYSERIIGLQKLIGQVEVMVAESGNPSDFNAAHWVAHWLEQPVPALNNAKPSDFMDTIEGQELVSSLLAKMQSGAYA